ncbi:MAG: hypothetical protein ACRDI0_08215 [Actinomycetota bacterium]
MDQIKKAFHAVLGSGDFAVEKSKELADAARRNSVRAYADLAGRGERVANRVRRTKPAKRAAEGTRQAARQVKGAYTSIRKAVGAEQPKTTTRKAG